MNTYDYRVLLRFKHTGNIAENQTVVSDALSIGNDEAVQIHKIEIIPPTNSQSGDIENMFVRLVIDNNQYPFVYLHSKAKLTIFGDHTSTDPLLNTCPKAKKAVAVEVIGGPGGVTGDFEVRLWGDYFKGDDALRNFFGATVFNNVPSTMTDPFRGKAVTVHHPVPLTISNFANLPGGGPKADKPNVFPIAIYNFNKSATVANMEYPLTQENVLNSQFPMFWDLDTNEAVIIDEIGADIAANGRYVGIKVGNEYLPVNNFEPSEIPLYPGVAGMRTVDPLTKLSRVVIINNELGGVFIQDNGTPIADKSAVIGILGKYIYIH